MRHRNRRKSFLKITQADGQPVSGVAASAHYIGNTQYTALDAIRKSRERDADASAQHGPVKILWRDGKPVA